MSKLDARRELPIAPYTPKPGMSMDTHCVIVLNRNKNRKRIELYFSFQGIKHERGFVTRSFGLSSPGKTFIVDASPTHKPSQFRHWETIIMGSIDSKVGTYWDHLQAFLEAAGRKLA